MEFKIKKEDLDFTIYTTIAAFARARSIDIIGNGFDGKESNYPLSEDAFKSKRDSTKYIVVMGEGVTFLILSLSGDYHKKSKLSTLVGKVKTPKLIIIKHSKQNIKEVAFSDYEIIDGDRYLRFDFTKVLEEKGGDINLIPHDEWENSILSKNFLVLPRELPRISVKSSEAIWFGYQIGDLVNCKYPAISSNGTTASVRLVSAENKN